ncbi:hypothetical protein CTEN210_16217 [Chaetoceros tenuissimus]|uniref:Kinesin light chain n=1 Tax=Chaetoceros tenuissimus TaxID=426638 RepID=A0AAD3D8C4_9STRA|nr:hypothetical protein CTEN210_16217 [Chaetoceros tenuissimus]
MKMENGSSSNDVLQKDTRKSEARNNKNPNEAGTNKDIKPKSILKNKLDKKQKQIQPQVVFVENPNAVSTTSFLKNGIKLSYLLNQFVKDCGGKEALVGLTTTDVCNQFVLPITKESKLSYCDLILEKAKFNLDCRLETVVSTSTVFVSHAWQCNFLDVLDVLEHHFEKEPDVIIWFDVLCHNQHVPIVMSDELWATTFQDSIRQIGRTVLVMVHWANPIPYRRTWCIFESYCTYITEANFEIAMSATECRSFIEECKFAPTGVIKKMANIVDTEQTKAFKREDELRIHSILSNEVGVQENSQGEIGLQILLGSLYFNEGCFDKAEPLYIDCLSKSKALLGPNHANTLTSMNNLAGLYKKQGKYGAAEPLAKACLTKSGVILGAHHSDTLRYMSNLAELYKCQGKYTRAASLYKACFLKSETIFGHNHPRTLTAMNSLGQMYESQGKYDMAEPLISKCYSENKKVFGTDHPDTLVALNSLAELKKSQGRYEEAEGLYKECLSLHQKVFGLDHPQTLVSMNNLGVLYTRQRKYDKAEPLLTESLSKQEQILGPHLETLTTMNNLATLYRNKGYYDKAEPLIVDSLSRSKRNKGPDHPETLTAINNLAQLYKCQGKYDEAKPIFKHCLSKREAILGQDHPHTLTSMSNLASLYLSLDKLDEAEPLIKGCLSKSEKILGPNHPDTLIRRKHLELLNQFKI